MRVNARQPVPTFNAHGGIAAVGFNFNNHLGMEFEFGGYFSNNVENAPADRTSFTYGVGPRLSWGRLKTFDPYVHALFGLNHASTTYGTASVSQSNFAFPLGGGIDIRFSKYFLFRPIQVDYYFTRFQTSLNTGQATPTMVNRNQNNLRWSAGMVFTFGAE